MFHIPRAAKQLVLSVTFFCHQEVRGLYGRTALQLGESSGRGPAGILGLGDSDDHRNNYIDDQSYTS